MPILIVFLLVILILLMNALFILAEAAFLSASSMKLSSLADKGEKKARLTLSLFSSPERFLSIIQLGNTLLILCLGLFAAESASEHIAAALQKWGFESDIALPTAHVFTALITTYFAVLAELLPKRLAMMYPETCAMYSSWVIKVFSILFYPLVSLLASSTKLIFRIFNIKETKRNVSISELKNIINYTSSSLDENSRKILKRLSHLSITRVGAIMTPRNNIVSIDINNRDFIEIIKKYRFKYFPITENNTDNIIGFIKSVHILIAYTQNKKINIKDYMLSPVHIPDFASLSQLLKVFETEKHGVAVVTDEYGGLVGMVGLSDILRALVGNLANLVIASTPKISQIKDEKYILDGNCMIEDVLDLLDIEALPGSENFTYRTLASFLLNRIKKLPRIHQKYTLKDWVFEITEIDARRISKVTLYKQQNQGIK